MNSKVVLFGILLLAAQFSGAGAAQEGQHGRDKPAAQNPELEAIRRASAAFVDAFNRGDAKGVAALWTEDGEYIDEAGQIFKGRTPIEEEYARFFAEHPGAKIQIAVESLRLLSPNAAIEEGQAAVDAESAGAAGLSQYTAVHIKLDGKWLMAVVRDAGTGSGAAVRSAADLDWLIGTWVAEEHGVKTESVCRWVADEHFIERKYTTTQVDGTKTTGVQLIGWNPQGGHVQSWDFSPDGGHAVGVWVPVEGGWQARVQGTTGDGLSTTAVNRLMRLDDNAYVWQSVQRCLGESVLPDTGEVVIKRHPAQ
ncbi:MAG: SgcJ/EcaC family oxidoreductase [Rhodopirellula sp.]|nr:SgcJ/EcaC family oxidoreductase [Rhodopirellula sp.]